MNNRFQELRSHKHQQTLLLVQKSNIEVSKNRQINRRGALKLTGYMSMAVKTTSDGRRRPLQVPTVISVERLYNTTQKITVGLLLVYGHYCTISRAMIDASTHPRILYSKFIVQNCYCLKSNERRQGVSRLKLALMESTPVIMEAQASVPLHSTFKNITTIPHLLRKTWHGWVA